MPLQFLSSLRHALLYVFDALGPTCRCSYYRIDQNTPTAIILSLHSRIAGPTCHPLPPNASPPLLRTSDAVPRLRPSFAPPPGRAPHSAAPPCHASAPAPRTQRLRRVLKRELQRKRPLLETPRARPRRRARDQLLAGARRRGAAVPQRAPRDGRGHHGGRGDGAGRQGQQAARLPHQPRGGHRRRPLR